MPSDGYNLTLIRKEIFIDGGRYCLLAVRWGSHAVGGFVEVGTQIIPPGRITCPIMGGHWIGVGFGSWDEPGLCSPHVGTVAGAGTRVMRGRKGTGGPVWHICRLTISPA